jgi:pyruvate dehydrogenase E2 component (dihydrolipoamide acetyltransferase)
MPFDFKLPDLGEGITEGEIRKWLLKEGDLVEEHQNVLEIETDKAIVEVPSPRAGTIAKINKEEGETVKVGEVLMTIVQEGETVEEKAEPQKKPKSVSVVGVLPEAEEEEVEEKEKEERGERKDKEIAGEVLATPAARAAARELGIQIEAVRGTGPGGSITPDDVKKAAGRPGKKEDVYGISERMPLRGLRKIIAKNLVTAQRTTAFVTGMEEADITELWNMREREKKPLISKGLHLTFLPFFIKAVQHALVDHPLLNASIDDASEEIIIKKYYNIGLAVDTPEGLMVPVIRNADKKTILELSTEIQALSIKARERKIKLEELKGSTFTITNYGHFGGIFATPIINYPDVAILGIGRVLEKPWVRNGNIEIRKILPLSLTFDHRVTDGVDASLFLTKIVKYLEDPALIFIESA